MHLRRLSNYLMRSDIRTLTICPISSAPNSMKQSIRAAFILIALIAGCGDDVVDVDNLTNGESIVGMWTLDLDSASDGTMELTIVESEFLGTPTRNLQGKVKIEDSTYICMEGVSNTRTYLNLWPMYIGDDRRGVWISGNVHPSFELIRGKIVVAVTNTLEIVLEDSVTAISMD